jgi:phosphoglycolate phosphatase-like HAD superfamily hydrolase
LPEQRIDTVVLDVDGTLVDTVYQHTMAWVGAFASVGLDVPTYRIHRAIGMGGDRLVTEVAGQEAEDRFGDELRSRHGERFGAVIDDVRSLPGAAHLLRLLRERGLKVVLASSGEPEQTDRLLRLVDGSDRVDARTTSEEADRSKPAPDLIDAAIERAGGRTAAVVGDAVWDIKAAAERDRYSIGLLSGGFGEGELRDAGAAEVFATPADLVANLDRTAITFVDGTAG